MIKIQKKHFLLSHLPFLLFIIPIDFAFSKSIIPKGEWYMVNDSLTNATILDVSLKKGKLRLLDISENYAHSTGITYDIFTIKDTLLLVVGSYAAYFLYKNMPDYSNANESLIFLKDTCTTINDSDRCSDYSEYLDKDLILINRKKNNKYKDFKSLYNRYQSKQSFGSENASLSMNFNVTSSPILRFSAFDFNWINTPYFCINSDVYSIMIHLDKKEFTFSFLYSGIFNFLYIWGDHKWAMWALSPLLITNSKLNFYLISDIINLRCGVRTDIFVPSKNLKKPLYSELNSYFGIKLFKSNWRLYFGIIKPIIKGPLDNSDYFLSATIRVEENRRDYFKY
jgi:hypothetical protein